MVNLAQLIRTAASDNPDARFGSFEQQDRLEGVLRRAEKTAENLQAAGLGRGDIVAIIGTNSASYIVAWMACQLSGIQTALINPGYPDAFLSTMLDDIAPRAILWVSREPGSILDRALPQFDVSHAWAGEIETLREARASPANDCDGADCEEAEIAAYLHTSGTSGNPKFCALSHGYFLQLGRYFSDVMAFTKYDTVFNPLPLFHINPMGNGVVGALSGSAGFLTTEKFTTDAFWPAVKRHDVTALILHAPPVSMLMARTTDDDARGHSVRVGFACTPPFLRKFGVPLGVGGYGSTEAGGFCHSWKFRPGDTDFPDEGALHLAGQSRHDLDWKIGDGGEILVREKVPNVLLSGYARQGEIAPASGADGWFHTGDRGRLDATGNLIFIERISESIRVNAEYVPIDFVEGRLKGVPSLDDFALWRLDSTTRGHEPVIYTVSNTVVQDDVRAAIADLPRYMHPVKVIRIAEIPRDSGVGKVRRRLLAEQPVLDVQALS